MKKILFTIALIAQCHFLFSQENILFKGHIKNFNDKSIHLSDIWGKNLSTEIDSCGDFSFNFEYNSGGFFNFSYNEYLIPVHLSINENLVMNFDYLNIDSTITYLGKDVDFNKALYNLSKGKPAPDFTLPDINEKKISLSEFKGQYIYIDVWTSYCGGCIKEIPYFEKLKKDFQGRNIVFLSISGDSKKERWLKVINKKDMTGIQLINKDFKSDFSNKYLNYGSPRYILIDKEQRIINANANKPSEITEILNNLEGI